MRNITVGLEKRGLGGLRKNAFQVVQSPLRVDVLSVLGCEVKASFRQPSRPYLGDVSVLLCLWCAFADQERVGSELLNRVPDTGRCVPWEERAEFIRPTPAVKKAKDLQSGLVGGNRNPR